MDRIASTVIGMAVSFYFLAGTGARAAAGFRVVGYAPSWGTDIRTVQFDKLTHVIWAFAAPGDDGTLSDFEGAKLAQLTAAAHAKGVKTFLAVGGGSNQDKGWQTCTASESGRQALVKACMAAVHQYDLDGIDFDWEYPDGGQVEGFNAAVKAMAAALHAEGKELSAAVTMNDWPHSFPTRELYDAAAGPGFDFLNIMVYDNPTPHSTLKHAQTGLDTWLGAKGLAREKCILGCPFYGAAGKYKDIVAKDPAAAWVDKDGAEDYNSIPTIKKKTDLALDRAGGIMFWEISQDAVGDLSLLSAVREVILARSATGVRIVTADPGASPDTPTGHPSGFWRSGIDLLGRVPVIGTRGALILPMP